MTFSITSFTFYGKSKYLITYKSINLPRPQIMMWGGFGTELFIPQLWNNAPMVVADYADLFFSLWLVTQSSQRTFAEMNG